MAFFKNKKQASQALAFLVIAIFFVGGVLALKTKKAELQITSEKTGEKRKRKKKPQKVIEASLPEGTEASITLKDFKRNSIKNDKAAWEITGEQASLYNLQNLAVIKKANLLVSRSAMDSNKLSADKAEVEFNDSDIKTAALFGNVKFDTAAWQGLTSKAKYFRETESVSSESPVELKSEAVEVQGTGFEALLNEKIIEVFEDVKSVINEKVSSEQNDEKKLKTTKITSVTASFNNKSGTFEYSQDVVAENPDFTIKSDNLKGNFTETQEIKNLYANGNVKIHRQTEKDTVDASAEKADFDMIKQIITLRGAPILDKNGSKVSADIIYYYVKEDRSVAEGNVQALLPE